MNDSVKIYQHLNINDAYTFPINTGALGRVLKAGSNGNVYWGIDEIGSVKSSEKAKIEELQGKVNSQEDKINLQEQQIEQLKESNRQMVESYKKLLERLENIEVSLEKQE